MHLKSSVRNPQKGRNGMVTRVPEGIISYLQLQHDDTIEWRMERIGDQRVVIISKI